MTHHELKEYFETQGIKVIDDDGTFTNEKYAAARIECNFYDMTRERQEEYIGQAIGAVKEDGCSDEITNLQFVTDRDKLTEYLAEPLKDNEYAYVMKFDVRETYNAD
jgi:hypothetical protein